MEEDGYDDGDGSYGEEEDDEKAGRRHSFHLNAWINNAIKHKLQVLSLSMDKVKDYTIALAPFASEILVVLKLGRNFELDISFPSLKVFHLNSIEFSRCSSTKNLFLSFPALENSDEECADYWAGNGNAFTDYEIIIDAPKLEVLRYKGYVASGCSFKNCLSVVRAVIDISDNGKRGDVSTIGLKPLTGTYNAKFLSLSGRSMKVFCSVNTSGLHVFSNLTQLKLECNEYCGQLLPELLEKSPNLEVLILGKDNAKLNARDLVKIHMGATAEKGNVSMINNLSMS
ncbi:hypothetical protein GOBAR_AA23413 [Gossypium barbadense]|uniref:FBD domain-containing protein n=1 Tax=Gossypium barbadense TaxID=3634 RepID=A0A2P5X1N8_GOSBA|nr:hypothetical protein GOBAR_AA23413 [Gossypium barbadense]